MLRNFLKSFFRLTKRESLPFVPLRTINVPVKDCGTSPPSRRMQPLLQTPETGDDPQNASQLPS